MTAHLDDSTSRITTAFEFAYKLHKNQYRKGTNIPYYSHLLAVAALVLEAGGDEDQVIAALLHDAAEDQGGENTLIMIQDAFGEKVAEIVRECSDTLTYPKPPWRERKAAYLAHLINSPSSVKLVSLADKLHNARSILRELRLYGIEIFDKFNGGKSGTLWYYTQLVDIFEKFEENFLVDEFSQIVREITQIADAKGQKNAK